MVDHVHIDEKQQALEQALEKVSEFPKRDLVIPRGSQLNRQQVVAAFHDAFELVGGIPRLVRWADENYNEFVKLYGKLLPSTSAVLMDAEVRHVIAHKLPPPRMRSGAIIRGTALNVVNINEEAEDAELVE